MKTSFYSYFEMNKRERLGFLLLILLITISFTVSWIFSGEKITSLEPLVLKIDEMSDSVNKRAFSTNQYSVTEKFNARDKKGKVSSGTLFEFDPNTLSSEGWEALGLSPKQALVIVNFRNKGGRFRQKSDVQKMYTISPEMFKKIEPYIKIESQNTTSSYSAREEGFKMHKSERTIVIIDINAADTAEWMKLKAIGPAFARRIVAFREKLGGFYSSEQLKEVYGIDPDLIDQLNSQLRITEQSVKTIPINTIDLSTLSKHPYISFKLAKAILNYRLQHGKFTSEEDLRKVLALDAETYKKIIPYIKF